MSKRVLVTGGAGFIGSHIAEAYLAAGWDVTVLDDLSRGQRKNVPGGARLVEADIRSPEAKRLVREGRFEVLNHHAAQIDVRVSVDEPARDAQINIVGLVNLLEGAENSVLRRVIFASSGGTVYGDPTQIPTSETAPNCPISPYGASKLAGEHYIRMLGALRGFDAVALRYANIFGPRQDPKSDAGVVSIFVSRLLAKQPLTIFGDGRQTRDYVYVGDVARANLLASSVALAPVEAHESRAFNIGTGHETSVLDLAATTGRVFSVKPQLEFAPPRPGELFRSCLDAAKAGRVLGWRPEVSVEAGLPHLVEWFRREVAA